jgi:hypothetical protein
MRIDYFTVSEQLKDQIVSCEMHGHGIELEGMKLKCCQISCDAVHELSVVYYIFSSSSVNDLMFCGKWIFVI